jgi:SprT-like family
VKNAPSDTRCNLKNKVNAAIKDFVTTNPEWPHNELAAELYDFYDKINAHFFGGKLPIPVFSFIRSSPRTMGYYVNGINSLGLYEQINLNPLHITEDRAVLYDTLAHEMVHCWQRNFDNAPKSNYHNRKLRDKMKEIGIPCDNRGHGQGLAEPFVSFLEENGVQAEEGYIPPPVEPSKPRKAKWTCGCTVITTDAGVKLQAICSRAKCGNRFRKL